MKFALLISSLVCAATVLAAPGVTSLSRSFKTVLVRDENNVDHDVQIACVECPCNGWSGDCVCIDFGCCCKPENPPQPPEGGWKV